jgi:hypothetical protein
MTSHGHLLLYKTETVRQHLHRVGMGAADKRCELSVGEGQAIVIFMLTMPRLHLRPEDPK